MKTIAVFDDDNSICKSIELLVNQMGMVCVSATSIPEAAFRMGKDKPDIVIADYEFKFGFNISLIAKLLKEKAEKVIILTSKNPDTIKREHPELSFAKFMRKGVSLRNIREEIA